MCVKKLADFARAHIEIGITARSGDIGSAAAGRSAAHKRIRIFGSLEQLC
jgi:hypothetical protein